MRRIDAAWTALLTAVILGPLLTGWGFWLFGDMVFVPEQPWKDAWLGLDGTLPRAVPMDAIVSVLTQVLPGELVQRLLLVGAFLAGGIGAGLFVRGHGTAARLAAITLMLWNPWVYERLLMGQWAILAGYFLLPWVALASLRMRRDLRRGALRWRWRWCSRPCAAPPAASWPPWSWWCSGCAAASRTWQ